MVYKQDFIVVVKCNGKILREKDGIINLPFGSDYSLLLKNLSSRKANINVSIDGSDVLSGSSLIIRPDTSMELEGFLENHLVKNKFRFIQKTQEIQDHRGDKIDDGLIRVEFAFEKEQEIRRNILYEDYHFPPTIIKRYHYHYDYPIFRWETFSSSLTDSSKQNSGGEIKQSLESNKFDFVASSGETIQAYNCSSVNLDKPQEDEGITVKGSETKQQFYYASVGELEPSKVIIIKLRGTKIDGEKVEKPVTVDMKLECPTCGKQNKSNNKYCPNCGTFLG
jgi:hypothetical protein